MNLTPTSNQKQLKRVFDLMSDGVWRTPEQIASITCDSKQAVTSRLRDLRLDKYGGYSVEAKKVDVHNQIWSYRLVKLPQSVSLLTSGSTMCPSNPATIIPPIRTSRIKFWNLLTNNVEYIPELQCREEPLGSFTRVVAVDAQNNIIEHLITTQSYLL